MKTTATALGMLAAVASAYSPPRHLHFPRSNGTESLTTVTIKTTQVHTIIDCAPTVTNCPAHATGIANLPDNQKVVKVVTDTIVLATTVCPVGDVGKVSSSILANSTTTGGPAPTTADTAVSSAKPGMTTKVIDVVTDKTLTMTMGTGSTASRATKTIRATSHKTITVPRSTDATAAPSTTAESTTTKTATTKVTRTLTITRAKAKPTVPAGNHHDNSDKGQCPASTVTVTAAKETVTVLASTVYVTVGACTTSAAEKPVTPTPPVSVKSSNGGDKSTDADKPHASSDCPDSTTTLQATVTVVPYPIRNGTHSTTGHANPTGFASLRH